LKSAFEITILCYDLMVIQESEEGKADMAVKKTILAVYEGGSFKPVEPGELPAVLYSPGTEEAISVDTNKLQGILQSEASEQILIDLFINGNPPERCHVRLRAVQTDSVSLAPLYADLYRVTIDRTGRDDTATAVQGRRKAARLESTWLSGPFHTLHNPDCGL
jgi:ribosomal protein L25 (general stress protein Ctc)